MSKTQLPLLTKVVKAKTQPALMVQAGLYRDLFDARAAYYTEYKIKAERANGEAEFNI